MGAEGTAPRWTVRAVGEAALLVAAKPDTPASNPYITALYRRLTELQPPGLTALVPGISSLLVRFDPLQTAAGTLERTLKPLLAGLEPHRSGQQRVIIIPVRYGGVDGPDLEAVAALCGVAPAEIVADHCSKVYPVLMLGFAPGFPYIGPVSELLSVPRRATPRSAVPAGSVALAAGLTGIYPARLPGGWHIIGRTALQLFDPSADPPTLLAAGDGVRFEALADGAQP